VTGKEGLASLGEIVQALHPLPPEGGLRGDRLTKEKNFHQLLFIVSTLLTETLSPTAASLLSLPTEANKIF
jgi:hypothetical protein